MEPGDTACVSVEGQGCLRSPGGGPICEGGFDTSAETGLPGVVTGSGCGGCGSIDVPAPSVWAALLAVVVLRARGPWS